MSRLLEYPLSCAWSKQKAWSEEKALPWGLELVRGMLFQSVSWQLLLFHRVFEFIDWFIAVLLGLRVPQFQFFFACVHVTMMLVCYTLNRPALGFFGWGNSMPDC